MNWHKKTNLIGIILGLFVAALVLGGCGSSSLKVGWQETSSLSHKKASFNTFDGIEKYSICTWKEKTIQGDYSLSITKGSLGLSLEEPGGQVLWEKNYQEDAEGGFEVSNTALGCYQLRISADEAGGSYEIEWSRTD